MQFNGGESSRLILEFTECYMEKIFYFCLKRTGNKFEAENLTHDIAMNVISSLNSVMPVKNFRAWLWQIARNRYSVWVENKRKHSERFTGFDVGDYDVIDENSDTIDEMIHGEQLSLLRRELAFIKGDYRNIVVAYYIENKSVRTIAKDTGLSESAIQQRLHRARKFLKEGMEMSREFGKMSYRPENMDFIGNGVFGANGEPWNFLNRTLCKNILLAAYRNPSTAEELAMEIGVAMPYMEEELNSLVESTLMKKNGAKYETNIFIVSSKAQERIAKHMQSIAPELTNAIISSLEYDVSWKNINCPEWHEGYQAYEDMKWTLLMMETDIINFQTLSDFEATRKDAVTDKCGSIGHTVRPNGGEWDVLGMEMYTGERADFVGLHGVSAEARELPNIDFEQFKYQYKDIAERTPEFLPYEFAKSLSMIAKGEQDKVSDSVLKWLEEHGYICGKDENYRPKILIMFNDKVKTMPAEDKVEFDALRTKAADIAMKHYLFCRSEILKEIPNCLKDDGYQIDHACINMFAMRGAVLEEALKCGYIKYTDDPKRMLGTFLRI